MIYTQMMGVLYWVIIYKPDGSSFKLSFAANSSSVTTTADQAGKWDVELWGEVVVPNSTPGLLGTCTFTVILISSAIRITTNTGDSQYPSVAASGGYVCVAWDDYTQVPGVVPIAIRSLDARQQQ